MTLSARVEYLVPVKDMTGSDSVQLLIILNPQCEIPRCVAAPSVVSVVVVVVAHVCGSFSFSRDHRSSLRSDHRNHSHRVPIPQWFPSLPLQDLPFQSGRYPQGIPHELLALRSKCLRHRRNRRCSMDRLPCDKFTSWEIRCQAGATKKYDCG